VLDILVDSEIQGMRDRAKSGDFDAMIAVVTHMMRGHKTPRNIEKSEQVVRHIIANKDQVEPHLFWDALCLLAEIQVHQHHDQAADQTALELVRNMVLAPPSQWNFSQLFSAVDRIQDGIESEEIT